MELQTRAQQGPREIGNQHIFDKFRKMNPTEFHGDADPYVAEEWINSLEVIFDYMGIQDAEKIECVDFMFKREARKWWQLSKMGIDLKTMTWEQFRELFFNKYFT